MEPAKVDVLIAQFAYGGNGGVPMVLPTHPVWISRTFGEMQADVRIGRIALQTLSDTPITMSRNMCVKIAQEQGYDFILMLDSDNVPDSELACDPLAKPFWQSSFDFAYERMVRGLPSLVCAPYCGPPPHENVYVFFWENEENGPYSKFTLGPFSRDAAMAKGGIEPIAAGPTGITLYSTSMFELMKPPYFYYEYLDEPYQTQKASTEDVTNFRDLCINAIEKHEEPCVFCNWDAWAGHTKIKEVRKPKGLTMLDINNRLRASMTRIAKEKEEVQDIDFSDNLSPEIREALDKTTDPDPCDVDVEDTLKTPDSSPDGVVIKKRNLFGHIITCVGNETPQEHLEALKAITSLVAQDKKGKALRCIEVGSWVGESARAIVEGFSEDGSTLYCVDNFSGSDARDPLSRVVDAVGSAFVKDKFVENAGDDAGKAIKLLDTSSQQAARMANHEADFIYLDAGHTYEDAKADIEAWLPHLVSNGYMAGHDYNEAWPGVVKAVDEAFGEIRIRTIEGSSIWVISKAEYLEWLGQENSQTT